MSKNLKKQVWETYIGPHIKTTMCPCCKINKISNDQICGYEAAHIVADKYWKPEQKLTVLYLFPSCSACNNDCRDINLFDFLYCRGRFDALRKLIRDIYQAFLSIQMDMINPNADIIHYILDELYGKEKFPAGGFIVNREEIYRIAKSEQLQLIDEQLKELQEQSSRLLKKQKVILESAIPRINFLI